jgi:hypothetical protein
MVLFPLSVLFNKKNGEIGVRALRSIAMWPAIQYVTSGLTLSAFIIAAVVWLLGKQSRAARDRIALAPEADRPKLVAKTLEGFDVDTTNLTREQQYDLAMKQIKARIERFRIIGSIVVVLGVLGAVTAYAISKRPPEQNLAQEQKAAQERSLLIEFDSRVSQMDARRGQIDEFKIDAEKGSATLCIYHLAAGDGICDGTGTAKGSLVGIVNDLTRRGLEADPTVALTTLGYIETEQGEILNSAGSRVYPAGY